MVENRKIVAYQLEDRVADRTFKNMENASKYACLLLISTLNIVQSLVGKSAVYNEDSLLRLADTYIQGWSKYTIEDEKLSPILSKLIVDRSSGLIHIDKSLYCDFRRQFNNIRVRSYKETNVGTYIEIIRSVPLLEHDFQCFDYAVNKEASLPDNSTLIILPKSMILDKAVLDISPFTSDATKKLDVAQISFTAGNCNQPTYLEGSSLVLDWRFVKILKTCAESFPVSVRLQGRALGHVVTEKEITVFLASNHLSTINKKTAVHKRSKRSYPTFPRPSYFKEVLENTPVGTTVITINVEPSSQPGLDITYAISPASIGFDIDAKTGAVTISRSPDYETIRDKNFYLTVTTSFASTRLVISIMDVNDNTPEFEQKTYMRTVSEDISSSASILEVKANDKDSGQNGDVSYSLKNPGGVNSAFEVDPYNGQVFLRNARLDRETTPRYELIITAEDNGIPKRSSETKVIITVSDVNDNSPSFDRPKYTHTISENVAPGSTLLRVTATDKDEGTNQQLSYRILYNDFSNAVLSKFEINRETGDIILKQALDYENLAERSVAITVEASDAGIPPRKGTAIVVIDVKDFNDNAPVFRQSCIEYVMESAKIGSVVCTVSASDRDASAPNNEIVYSLGRSPADLPFAVDPATGQVKVTNNLDYDDPSKRSFEFTIIATDRGVPPKSMSTIARIKLTNVNDNYPVFSKPHYEVSIPETTPPGTSILQVSASDIDQPDGKDFQFYITKGNEKNCFSISNAIIYVQCSLNYDLNKAFNLSIEVKDSGQLGLQLSTETFALIRILDANTHAPSFVRTPDVSAVPEDAKIGTPVVKVEARDLDSGENGRISYSLISSDGYFKIDPVTGQISTEKELDSERNQKHTLTVMARDHGSPVKSSTTTLAIAVTDVNDNAPMFQRPKYEQNVKEDVAIGTAILRVRAVDADVGSTNRMVYYKIPSERKCLLFIEFYLRFIHTFIICDSFTLHTITPLFQLFPHILFPFSPQYFLT